MSASAAVRSDRREGVLIVGAGLGGARVAENLRVNGYRGPIRLIGAESHLPYDRPPLSKALLAGQIDDTALKPAEFYREAEIELLLGTRVSSVDAEGGSVTVVAADGPDEGRRLRFESLVLATGLRPRRLAGLPEGLDGVHVLRSLDDALALRDRAAGASRAVVVGAGFIGCEVAATLAGHDVAVTVVEAGPIALGAVLGVEVGKLVQRWHETRGVDVRTGTGVSEVLHDGRRVTGVRLSDGTSIAANLVVVGIGSELAVEYLDGSGVQMADPTEGGGVACDVVGRSSVPGIYAVGDIAAWVGSDGRRRRVEHWNRTVEQAAIVARHLAGVPEPATMGVSYFWSDQYELKLQVLGDPDPRDSVTVVEDDGERFIVYFSRDGLLTGVAGAGRGGPVMRMRRHLAVPTRLADVV